MKKIFFFCLLFVLTIITNAQVSPQLKLPLGHTHQISTFCISPDNKFLITGSEEESKIVLWQLNNCKQLTAINSESKGVNKLIMSPGGTFFVASFFEGLVVAYDFPSLKIKWKIESKEFKTNINFLCKGKYIKINELLIASETGVEVKEAKRVSYFIDDSTYVVSNKNGDDVIDIKTFGKIKTIKIFPFKENRYSSYNTILNFNRKDSSCLFNFERYLICFNNFDSLRYIIDMSSLVVDIRNIPNSNLILAYCPYEKIFKIFNVENGEIKVEKNLVKIIKGTNGLSTGLKDLFIDISPDGKNLIVNDKLFLLSNLDLVQSLYNDYPNQFISNNEIVSIGLFPSTYTLKNTEVYDLSTDKVDTIYQFAKNDIETNIYAPTINQTKFDKNQFIFNVNNEKIQSFNLIDYSTKILSNNFFNLEIQHDVINEFFPKFSKAITDRTDSTISFEIIGKENTEFKYTVEAGFYVDDVLQLNEANQYLIKSRARPFYQFPNRRKESKDKIIILNISEKKVIHEYKLDKALFDVRYDTSRSLIILNENNNHLHIIDANTFQLKEKINIDRISKKAGWFNNFDILDSTGRLLFYPANISLHFESNVIIFNWQKNIIELELTVPFTVKFVSFSPDLNFCYLFTGSELNVWDVKKKKIIFHYLPLENGNWCVYDEDYHYDGSPDARNMLYFVCGLEVVELNQMKDALFVPGLAEKIMSGQAINYKKLSALDICGTLPLIDTVSKNDKGYHFKITPRKYPLERLDLQVNNKNVITIQTNRLAKNGNDLFLDLTEQEISKHFIAGQSNLLKVFGVVKDGNTEITTRALEIIIDNVSNKKANSPNLYAVMIGINDYKDTLLRLNFASKDAVLLSKSVEKSAKKLLGDGHVFVYNVNSDLKNNQVKVFTTPEKEGVRKVLEEIGMKSKPEDIVMIFFAGHGVMQGTADKKFTLLTAEASKDNLVGISTNDLKSWLSPEGPNKMLANKCILIFDACNSGQASQEMSALARSDDESNRIRQVEELKDKSGMFILAASAPNQSAYELPQYQQGLLTYCLLSTLKNDPNILDDNKYLNVQKWFLQTEELLKKTMENFGLKQNVQPFGTANIKIGLVDDAVKNGIQLAKEKPAVLCISAEDKSTDEDVFRLKDKLNAKLLEITSRGIVSPIIYIEKETSNANAIKLKYEVKSGKIICDIIFLKNQKKFNQGKVEGNESDLDVMIDLIIGVVKKNIL